MVVGYLTMGTGRFIFKDNSTEDLCGAECKNIKKFRYAKGGF